MKLKLFISFFLTFFAINSFAQRDTVMVAGNDTIFVNDIFANKDTIDTESDSNPKRAVLYSAILPGLGQVYNKKYWKVPIVYGAMGTALFLADHNNKNYQTFLNAYIAETDDDTLTVSAFPDRLDDIIFFKKKYKRDRDLALIVTGVLYVFNLVDASVDSHFTDYDVGDDLSFHIEPAILRLRNQPQNAVGLSLALRF